MTTPGCWAIAPRISASFGVIGLFHWAYDAGSDREPAPGTSHILTIPEAVGDLLVSESVRYCRITAVRQLTGS